MGIYASLQDALYIISNALIYPVMIFLLIGCVRVVVYTGGFVAEWTQRIRLKNKGDISQSLEKIEKGRLIPEEIISSLSSKNVQAYAKAIINIVSSKESFKAERIEELFQSREESFDWEINKIRLWVRIGPSLGLMGTLIPMGTGLSALTEGNMAQLSSSLILAFTTTVVGLLVGIFAYFFVLIKERWCREDLRTIRLITEIFTKNNGID